MNYNAEELFAFDIFEGRCRVIEYLKKDDPSITELEIPNVYNGKPVQTIASFSFENAEFLKHVVIPPKVSNIDGAGFAGCKSLETVEFSEGLNVIETVAFMETNLKRITLPKSLSWLCSSAFESCHNLESVTFNSKPHIDLFVFSDCPKLPPETVAMGLVRSTDITRPISGEDIRGITTRGTDDPPCDCFRPDVFELLAKNRSFRNCDLEPVFYGMINFNKPELLPAAERYGMLEDAGLVDRLISLAVKGKKVECTAYLLDLKNRKFGFKKDGDLDL